jgi:hypothetical protein
METPKVNSGLVVHSNRAIEGRPCENHDQPPCRRSLFSSRKQLRRIRRTVIEAVVFGEGERATASRFRLMGQQSTPALSFAVSWRTVSVLNEQSSSPSEGIAARTFESHKALNSNSRS